MRALTGFACAIACATFSACSYAAPQESGVSEAPVQAGDDTSAPDVLAPAGTYKIDRSHSSIVWRIDHLGLAKYTARFNSFEVTLDIDPAEIPRLLPFIWLCDYLPDSRRFRYRLMGDHVRDAYDNNITGRYVDELVSPSAR